MASTTIDMAEFAASCTEAKRAIRDRKIQSLWSGYGEIVRMRLDDSGLGLSTTIVKRVAAPKSGDSSISHTRKLQSYRIETSFYQNWSKRCSKSCRVPRVFGTKAMGQETWMVLEDLDNASGTSYPLRLHTLDDSCVRLCLSWLAYFHATFMNEPLTDLWPVGTYWHLETRPDEWSEMGDEGGLKRAAAAIDRALNECHFQTAVHGDAKLQNFCFSRDKSSVAAVDFQYVGRGCGMKDVAYFLGSGWGGIDESETERRETELLDYYFSILRSALAEMQKDDVDFAALESEWREMYPIALADFHRFLAGWSPGHWQRDSYGYRVTQRVVQQMLSGSGSMEGGKGGKSVNVNSGKKVNKKK